MLVNGRLHQSESIKTAPDRFEIRFARGAVDLAGQGQVRLEAAAFGLETTLPQTILQRLHQIGQLCR